MMNGSCLPAFGSSLRIFWQMITKLRTIEISYYVIMDNSHIVKKQLAIRYAGNLKHYERFQRLIGASPTLYPHDYLFFNDDVEVRHCRNIKELAKLRQLLKEDKIEAAALPFNVFNTYYPSYLLTHHFSIFLPILQQFATHKEAKELCNLGKKLAITGAYFHDKIRLDFKTTEKELPTISDNGTIHMNPETYFYSGTTSPYTTHSAFLAQDKKGLKLVVVELRNSQGVFSTGIIVRDMGATVSDDYLAVGYNFAGVRPLFAIELTTPLEKKIHGISLKQRFDEFGFSLKDLQKSLHVTINYTKMRRQFKTIDSSKEQRRIISYQAVATRIINGFATFVALSDLYSRIIDSSRSHVILSDLFQSAHHIILEDLIHLRECCGGFGYMQVSGHPGCIERVCFRAGGETDGEFEMTPEFLIATQYFAASESTEKYYCQSFSADKPSYMNFFGAFLSIVFNMRRNHDQLTGIEFKREFLRQGSLMAMHGQEEFSRHGPSNIHCQLLQYAITSYVAKRSAFINWSLLQGERKVFFQSLHNFRTNLLQTISNELESLGESLELSYLRNTIVGQENSEEFYKKVAETSKANLRNEKGYLAYIQAPIVEMIANSRAKL